MDFTTLEGLEEFFSDGVLDPSLANPVYRVQAKKYKEVAHRVFLLHEPDTEEGSTEKAAAGGQGRSTAEFDVVFIHGIGSDEFKCWTNEKGILWPASFLPQDFPSARVLTVGYAHALWNWKRPLKEAESAKTAAARKLEANAAPEAVSGGGDDETTQRKGAVRREAARGSFEPLRYLPSFDAPWKSLWESSSRKTVGEVGGETSGSRAPSSPLTNTTPAAPRKAVSAEREPVRTERDEEKVFPRGSLYKLLMQDTVTRTDMRTGENELEKPSTKAAEAEKQDARQLQSFRLVAADIADRLVSAGVGTGERPVVFVAHSMGGLIVKQMVVSLFQLIALVPRRTYLSLAAAATSTGPCATECVALTDEAVSETKEARALTHADAFLHSIRGVVFYGTPHFGSGLASVITGMQRYYSSLGGLTPTHVVTGLGDHNRGALTMLNDRFMEVVARLEEQGGADLVGLEEEQQTRSAALTMLSAPSAGVSIMSFGEMRKLKGLLRVVEPESANPAPDNPRFPFHLIDGDHSQINRPIAKTSPGYAMLYGFLDRQQQRGILLPPRGVNSGSSVLLADGTGECSEAQADDGDAAGANAMEAGTGSGERAKLVAFESEAWGLLQDEATKFRGRSLTPLRGPAMCNEVIMAMRSLDETQAALRATLSRFFGQVIPPQLGGIFLLGADVGEFLKRGTWLLQRMEEEELATNKSTGRCLAQLDAHYDFTKSFLIPTRLLVYWTQRAINMVDSFEQEQCEIVASQTAVEATREAALASPSSGTLLSAAFSAEAGGNPSFVAHLSTHSVREMDHFEEEVGVLQGEWEGFRRYLSMAIRQEALYRQESGEAAGLVSLLERPHLRSVSDERVAVVFFARAVRSLVTQSVRGGECLADLVGHFIHSSVELVSSIDRLGDGGCRELSGSFLVTSNNKAKRTSVVPEAPLSDGEQQTDRLAGFDERDAFAALLAESLELFDSCSDASQFARARGTPLSERGRALAGKAISKRRQMQDVLPPLHATSNFMLACFHLFLDEFPARASVARSYFDNARESLEDYRRTCSRLEQAERVQRKRRKGEERGARGPFPWWQDMSDGTGEESIRRLGDGSRNEEDDIWQRVRVLTEAFHLLVNSFACFTFVEEIYAKLPIALRHDEEEMTNLVQGLTESVGRARAAYSRAERTLEGRGDDLSRPFAVPQGGTKLGSNSAPGGKPEQRSREDNQAKDLDGFEKTKKAFRGALAGVLKELDDVLGGPVTKDAVKLDGAARGSAEPPGKVKLGGSEKVLTPSPASSGEMEPRHAAGTGWLTKKAGSLPKLLINGVLNAWEAVRRGEEARQTPRFFASNAFVFWWSVEESAERIVRVGVSGDSMERTLPPFPSTNGGESRKAPESYENSVATFGTGGRGCHPPPHAATPLETRKPSTTAAQRAEKELLKRQEAYFSAATTKMRCQWMTASGFTAAAGAHQHQMETLREQVRKLMEAPSDAPIDPGQVSRRVAAVLAEVRSPVALGDATQLDSVNPLTRCMLGHWHFLNLRSSPDAAHAYARVMNIESDPLSDLFQAAAVGLGWVHLHRLGATLSSECAGIAASHRARWEGLAAEQGVTGGLTGSRDVGWDAVRGGHVGGILDSLALRASPDGFAEFCSEAKDLLAFSASLASVGNARAPTAASSFLSTPSTTALSADVQRLTLADTYFRKVLRADPTNVGALCGIARIRSLVPRADAQSSTEGALLGRQGRAGRTGGFASSAPQGIPWESGGRGAASGQGVAASLNVREVTTYLEAAARASGPLLRRPTHYTAKSMLAPVFGSYAAYWLGNITMPSRALQAGTTAESHSAARETASLAAQQRAAALARSRQWYARAVELDPCNDWALTSLGLSYLRQEDTCHPPEGGTESSALSRGANTARGLGMLAMALAVNPTNQWALWCVANRSPDSRRRDECFRLLRGCLSQRYRGGRRL